MSHKLNAAAGPAQYLCRAGPRLPKLHGDSLPCRPAPWRISASQIIPKWHQVRHVQSRQLRRASQASIALADREVNSQKDSSNPPMAFPCLDALETKSTNRSGLSLASGPEPSYHTGRHLNFHSQDPILLDWGGVLPQFNIAYETWGDLNRNKSNAILLHTGLSASSHAHSTPENTKSGWWEKFIGPGGALDTDKYYIICTNVIGGCYGSTGPGSFDPANNERYATRFPILTMEDMVRAQFRLLDDLGIDKLYASVGASMGGMQSLAAGTLYPERVGKIASISGCARSHPYSIAMRHTQRQGERSRFDLNHTTVIKLK
ncbi:MAG: hypothetical protein M1825_001384 [Sarcosagium campestre]|nr:MAG: hypothetical protein M1825_001384 [Sarcosagium campestre]